MNRKTPRCAKCDVPLPERTCRVEKGRGPADCPTLHYKQVSQDCLSAMQPDELEFMRQATVQEKNAYVLDPIRRPIKPRIVETVEFARRMGYKKLGLIFCVGVRKEAAVVAEIFETNGFEVASILCKAGRMPKTEGGLGLPQKMQIDTKASLESACNPVFQATVINDAKVDFAVLMGLCVGHDSLVLKHLNAPATILAVKDRLLGHNPLSAIYMYDSYYSYLKQPLP